MNIVSTMTGTEKRNSMKMKQLLLVFAAMVLSSASAVGQDYYGIYSNAGLLGNLVLASTAGQLTPGQPQTVGDATGVPFQSVAFGQNTSEVTDTGIRVTAAYTNQQYIVDGGDTGGADHPSMLFGAQSNDTAKVLTGLNVFVPMNNVATPVGSFYSPATNSIGSGINPATTYAFEQYVSTERLRQLDLDTNGTFYMGRLTYTFSEPVDYPILHVTGLGGFFSTDFVPGGGVAQQFFSVDLELASGAPSLTRLSGTTYTVLDDGADEFGTRIRNSYSYQDFAEGGGTGTNGNEAGSGSFLVAGTGVTSVTFNVYVVGKMELNGNPVPSLWSTVAGDPNPKYSGDRFNTSWTIPLNDPTAVTMGDVRLDVTGVSDFLDSIGSSDLDAGGLLALLEAWDQALAAGLEWADRDVLLAALRDYLDPDGDGQVVIFEWETLEERGTMGFYAEREAGETWTPINVEMLPSLPGAPMGAEYWLVDPGAQSGDAYRYRLIEVDAWGKSNTYGPFDLSTPAP